MPTIQVQTPPAVTAELVPLAQLAVVLRLDLDANLLKDFTATPQADLTGYDQQRVADLQNVVEDGAAARELVEAYTGRYYAPQTLALIYRLDEPYLLPPNATAVSVSGFFTDLTQLDTLSSWLVEYQKAITVERQLPLAAALQQTYEVIATTTGDKAYLNLAKSAVKELVSEWYKNRETSAYTQVTTLPVSWQVKLAAARVNPLGVSV